MHLTEALELALGTPEIAASVAGSTLPWPWLAAAGAGLILGVLLGLGVGRGRQAALRERLRWLDGERSKAQALGEENGRLRGALAEARARHEADRERVSWLHATEEQMRTSFESLARGVLHEGGGELSERSREALGTVVEPLRLTLAALDTQVRELERDRQGAYEGLRRELLLLRDAQRQLHGTTRDLRQALLTSAGSRGRWGEVQLRRLVEMAGLLPHVDFVEQPVIEGGQRPDLIVFLPGNGHLPIDAKTPLRAYLAAAEEDDPEARKARLEEHLRDFKKRVVELGSKAYWQSFEGSPDFVIMFLPHDGVLGAAFERDPHVLDFCIERKVLPATPVTLLALLRTVAWGWQRQHVAEGAERIAGAGRQVHRRLSRVIEHLRRVGRSLDATVLAYNDTVGSMQRRLLPATRRLEEAAALEDPVELPDPVVAAPRLPERD